ncbi:hypothetical protein [Nonomuraea roseola]|uniref:Uncharacterized protein n=1 Tax=Nonomuraea roseola TaxID=46179 RepID=A0ABV5QG57_9ACTN
MMADFDLPADLVQLKREWFAADEQCQKLSEALPSNVAVGLRGGWVQKLAVATWASSPVSDP